MMKKITVLRVYKDELNNHVAVEIREDGSNKGCSLVTLPMLISWKDKIIAVNFTVVNNKYIRGKGCRLEFVTFLSSSEIMKRFSGQMVCVHPYITEDGKLTSRITYGVPIWNGSVEDYVDEELRHPTNDYGWIITGAFNHR